MTEPYEGLDLNKPLAPPQQRGTAQPAEAPPVLERPTPVVTADLTLSPPEAVPAIRNEQASQLVPIDTQTMTALEQRAAAFVEDLAGIDHRSPEFTQKINAISGMGERESREAAAVSNRMLERPASALAGSKGKKGSGPTGDAQVKVANTLADLRHTVDDLDPAKANLTGVKKLFRSVPGGTALRRYFERYQSAQQHLDGIIRSLASGQDELRKDNAAIDTERANLWALMGKLQEYATLAQALDAATESKVVQLRQQGASEQAEALTSDALFPIRQRHQDILTQLAVAAQGYLALDLVRKNNLELIKGVDRAQTTTVAALRTAVIVAQALANQKLVLDQINALNATTNQMIESTSVLLRQQGAAINQQASESTVSIESLQRAFDNVFATMDAIDSYKAQAVQQMGYTVHALEGQIKRAQPYLERSHTQSIGDGSARDQLPGGRG